MIYLEHKILITNVMNNKLRNLISEKCKDMGLTDKALDELAELGSKGLTEDSSDEDITKQVDSLVPFAKAMQGEITRKTQKKKPQSIDTQSDDDGDSKEGEDADIDARIAKQLAPLSKQIQSLKTENELLKAEKTKGERMSAISAKAKELGIPDYLMKHYAIADDADIDAELTSYKQELVNNNLVKKDDVHEAGNVEKAMKANAKSWADSLPDR